METAGLSRRDRLRVLVLAAVVAAMVATYWVGGTDKMVPVQSWLDRDNQQGLKLKAPLERLCGKPNDAYKKCQATKGDAEACKPQRAAVDACNAHANAMFDKINSMCYSQIASYVACAGYGHVQTESDSSEDCRKVVQELGKCQEEAVAEFQQETDASLDSASASSGGARRRRLAALGSLGSLGPLQLSGGGADMSL